MTEKLFYRGQLVDGQCGIGRLFSVHTAASYNKMYLPCPPKTDVVMAETHYLLKDPITRGRHGGGTGFFGTGFIDDARCKAAYELLASKYPLVFQTPVRKNSNSGNTFFYAMFDDTKQTDVNYIPPKWPFIGESSQ